jgi:pyrimidine-nucleoside phosphorylase
MNQPLGSAVGNALELREALDTLGGQGPADFRRHCLAIAGQMLLLSAQAQDDAEAVAHLEQLLDNGQALAKFHEWISAQGGDTDYVEDPGRLPTARFIRELQAPRSGYVAGLDAREVGLTSMLLGGGRAKKSDSIDYAVGIVLQTKIGNRVEQGQPMLTIHANDEARLAGARQRLLAAYRWSDEPVNPPPSIRRTVG